MNPWYLLTLFLDTLPLCTIQYYCLKNTSRYSLPKTLIISDSITICLDFLIAHLASLPFSNLNNMVVLRFSIFIVLFLIRLWLIPNMVWQNLYLCLINLPFVLSGIGTCAIFIPGLSAQFPNAPDYMIISLLRCLYYALIFYPVYKLWNRYIFPSVEVFRGPSIWITACGIQFLTNTGLVLCTQTDYYKKGISNQNLGIFLVMSFMSIIISIVLFSVVDNYHKQFQYEADRKNSEHLLALQSTQYEALTDSVKEMQRIRHDIKHHLRTIETMITEGKNEEAITYIQEYFSTIPSSGTKLYCDESAVNALLNHYRSMAENSSVNYDVKVQLSIHNVSKVISCIDLCILLGNAIENAYEATKDIEDGFIRINISEAIGNLYVSVDNNYLSDTLNANSSGNYLSHKRNYNNTGIGIYSMKTIAEKYNGEFSTYTKDGIFYLNAIFPM